MIKFYGEQIASYECQDQDQNTYTDEVYNEKIGKQQGSDSAA